MVGRSVDEVQGMLRGDRNSPVTMIFRYPLPALPSITNPKSETRNPKPFSPETLNPNRSQLSGYHDLPVSVPALPLNHQPETRNSKS